MDMAPQLMQSSQLMHNKHAELSRSIQVKVIAKCHIMKLLRMTRFCANKVNNNTKTFHHKLKIRRSRPTLSTLIRMDVMDLVHVIDVFMTYVYIHFLYEILN